MNAVTTFTPSSQLRRVAAFGGSFNGNGNGHEGLLDVEPGMTWDDVFFKQSDGTALLGFVVYDNVAQDIKMLISSDSEFEASAEVHLKCESAGEIANGEWNLEDGEEPRYQYARVTITREDFEAELTRVNGKVAEQE